MTVKPTGKSQELKALVESHTRSFPTFSQSINPHCCIEPSVVVLLSGSTGAFGSNVLAKLAVSTNVGLVYGVSRPSASDVDVYERHARAFRREGLDTNILESEKVRLVEGDLSAREFGMENKLFQQLKASVTHIIHNGWQVNFNRPVSMFEPNIRSIRNLVDFALTTKTRSNKPVKLIFISSLGVFRNTYPLDPDRVWTEEHLSEPDSALGLGYTEAKWVSENILDQAAKRTSLRPTVVRLGQLVGGPSGYWNEREWFAAIIKSSLLFGMLPNVPGVLSWNRSHIAAQALIDMLDTEERYLHLVHPRPIPWTELMTIFSEKLQLPIVHIDDWMIALHRTIMIAENTDRLSSSSLHRDENATTMRLNKRETFRQNPAARMLNYFLQQHESCKAKPLFPDRQTVWTPLVRCDRAIKASRTLQDPHLPQIGESDVERWIENWKRMGFLQFSETVGISQRSHL